MVEPTKDLCNTEDLVCKLWLMIGGAPASSPRFDSPESNNDPVALKVHLFLLLRQFMTDIL